ncbi:MAG: PorV/PorQ family protein [Bacteroidetes bacterium]|nr:PorV/PorQ family protein [Bacteroidota bacterium]
MKKQTTDISNQGTILRNALALLLLLLQSAAGQEFKNTATAGFVFLELPATARASALGEASLALSDVRSAALFTNPGALGFMSQSHSFTASAAPWLADIMHYSSSYAVRTDAGVFGIGMTAVDYGDIPRTVIASGQKVFDVTGSYTAGATSVGLSYSRMLTQQFSFGATIKYAEERIDTYAASNVLFDGGILYFTGLGSLRIAAAIQNFGVNAKFINDEFKMPSVLRMGVAAEVMNDPEAGFRMTVTGEALHPNDNNEKLHFGTELAWNEMIVLRGGYKFFYDEESFTAGIGLDPKFTFPLQIDISYSDYGRLGAVTRLTIQAGVE